MFDEQSINKLRSYVERNLSTKRFLHTLGVERLAAALGEIIIPDKVDEIRVAALLHDITKELPINEQLSLMRDSDKVYSDEDYSTIPALHSFSAPVFIKKHLSEYATVDVLSAVENHTLASNHMTLFDEIVFLSDYAEDGRQYASCVAVRSFISSNILCVTSYENSILSLHKAALMAIDATIDSLILRGQRINKRTINTKKYLEKLI